MIHQKIYDAIDNIVLEACRFLGRELIWIRDGKYWLSFQDLLRDPYERIGVAYYDLDLFVVHIIDSKINPNKDPNIANECNWGTYNLAEYTLTQAKQDYEQKRILRIR